MDKLAKDIKLLEECIEHWRSNLTCKLEDVCINGSCCPLCPVYFADSNTCEHCPIAEKTGIYGCRDTPWANVSHALHLWNVRGVKHWEWEEVVNEEIKFLVDLKKELESKLEEKKNE